MGLRWISWIYTIFIVLFLLGPLIVILPTSFGGSDMFEFPPQSFTLQNYEDLSQNEMIFSSLGLSLGVGVAATLLACLVGLCAGLGIVRGKLPFQGLLESFFLGPLIVPLVTTGIGFLIFFVPFNLVGSPISIIIAHSVIISPYVIRIVIASLRHFDPVQEEAAMIHGASPWFAFRTVVFPQLKSAVIASSILAFLVSLDEYTVTVFLTQAESVTLPIRIYHLVSIDINPVVTAISSLMVILSFLFIFFLEKKFQIHQYLEM